MSSRALLLALFLLQTVVSNSRLSHFMVADFFGNAAFNDMQYDTIEVNNCGKSQQTAISIIKTDERYADFKNSLTDNQEVQCRLVANHGVLLVRLQYEADGSAYKVYLPINMVSLLHEDRDMYPLLHEESVDSCVKNSTRTEKMDEETPADNIQEIIASATPNQIDAIVASDFLVNMKLTHLLDMNLPHDDLRILADRFLNGEGTIAKLSDIKGLSQETQDLLKNKILSDYTKEDIERLLKDLDVQVQVAKANAETTAVSEELAKSTETEMDIESSEQNEKILKPSMINSFASECTAYQVEKGLSLYYIAAIRGLVHNYRLTKENVHECVVSDTIDRQYLMSIKANRYHCVFNIAVPSIDRQKLLSVPSGVHVKNCKLIDTDTG